MKKPKAVKDAELILYISSIIITLSTIYTLLYIYILDDDTINYVISCIILFFLVYMIGKGKNWSRILFFVLHTIGQTIYYMINQINNIYESYVDIVFIITFILECTAFILLFQKQSSDWFRKMD
jgi:hypothetical protein